MITSLSQGHQNHHDFSTLSAPDDGANCLSGGSETSLGVGPNRFTLTNSQKCALGDALYVHGGSWLGESLLKLKTDSTSNEQQQQRSALVSGAYDLVLGVILSACIKSAEGDRRPNPNPDEICSQNSLAEDKTRQLFLFLGGIGETFLSAQRANWGKEAFETTLLDLLLSKPIVGSGQSAEGEKISSDNHIESRMLNALFSKHGVEGV
jgi:hypothetical protein